MYKHKNTNPCHLYVFFVISIGKIKRILNNNARDKETNAVSFVISIFEPYATSLDTDKISVRFSMLEPITFPIAKYGELFFSA